MASISDEPTGLPPNEFSDIRDAIFPPETDPDAMIAKVGEIWQGWGWYVRERDGFFETEPIRLCAGRGPSPHCRGCPSGFRRSSKPTPDERFSPGPAVHAGEWGTDVHRLQE